MSSLSDDQLRVAFCQFDTDESDSICIKELLNVINKINQQQPEKDKWDEATCKVIAKVSFNTRINLRNINS